MDSNIAPPGFEGCLRDPSPAPVFSAMPLVGRPAHFNHLATSSSSSESGSFYHGTGPFTSVESVGSMTSWPSLARQPVFEERYRILLRENQELSRQVTVWQAKYETLLSAYNLLIEKVPSTPKAVRPKLREDDFKNVTYWYKHQWTAAAGDRITEISDKVENDEDEEDFGEEFRATSPVPSAQRGQGRSRAGINVSLRYIQNEHGKVIDSHRARDIRMHARALFVGFAMQGKNFKSWGDADADSRKYFYDEMAIRFEELQYCDLDWKSEQIATETFPGWKTTWLKKKKKTALELSTGTKRIHTLPAAVEEPNLKRSKNVLESTHTVSTSFPEASSQLSVPVVNIVPDTPARQVSESAAINNPLLNGDNLFMLAVDPSAGQLVPGIPSTMIATSQPGQAEEANGTQPNLPNPPQGPVPPPPTMRRSRPGAKMRPSKTSVTPRNLCALDWVISNPKGTVDQFSMYYEGLSTEEKQKWEKLSVETREGKSTA